MPLDQAALDRLNELNSKMMNAPLTMSDEEIKEFIKLCHTHAKSQREARQGKVSKPPKQTEPVVQSGTDFMKQLAEMMAKKKQEGQV